MTDSVSLSEEMNYLQALPEVAIKILANKPGMLEKVCRRTFLPGDTWFYLWKKARANSGVSNDASGSLLARLLTPAQVAVCVDEIVDDPDLMLYFLTFNNTPQTHTDKFLEKLPSLSYMDYYCFVMSGSVDAEASKEMLNNLKYSSEIGKYSSEIGKYLSEIGVLTDLTFWYAYNSGEETESKEIVEHFDALTMHPSYHSVARSLNDPLCYLFSRRPEIAKLYNGRTEIDLRIHLAILRTEAVFHVEAASLNAWFINDTESKDQIQRTYFSEEGPRLSQFDPGNIPKEFASMIGGKSNYRSTSCATTIQRLETILEGTPLSITEALANNFSIAPMLLSHLSSHKKEFSDAEEKLAAPLHFTKYSDIGEKRWVREERALKTQNGLATQEQLDSTLYGGRSENFVTGALVSLKDADVTDWDTFLTVGENHTGTLSELLRACQALK